MIDGGLITPIIIQMLGPWCWGLWASAKQAQSYIALAELRSSGTMKTILSATQHQSQPQEFRRLLGAAVLVSSAGIILMIVAGFIFSWIFTSTLEPLALTQVSLRTVIFLVVSAVAVTSIGALAGSALRGCNQDYKSLGFRLGISAVCSTLVLLAVSVGWGIVGLAAATLFGAILTATMWFLLARASLTWFGIERPTSSYLFKFLRQCLHNSAGSLGLAMLLNSDTIVILFTIGAEAAGLYAATISLARLAMSAADTVTASTSSGIAGLVGSAQSAKACAVVQAAAALTMTYVIGAGVALLLVNQSIVPRWLGENFRVSQFETIGMVTLLIAQQRFRFVIMVAQVTLEFRQQSKILLIAGALGIVIAIISCELVGVVGVAFGFAASAVLASSLTMRLIRTILGDSIASATAIPPKTMLLGGALLLLSCAVAPNHLGWISIIILALVGFIISGSIMAFLGTELEVRYFVLSRIPIFTRLTRQLRKPRNVS